MDEIKKIIKQKINEHNLEINISEDLKKKLREAKINNKLDLTTIQNLAVLKDKYLFHKTAILVLNDLLEELTKE